MSQSDGKYQTFRLTKREPVAEDIDSFYFEPIDGGMPVSFQPGQFVRVHSADFAHDCIYSLSDRPGLRHLRLTVKLSKVPGCSHAIHALRVGDSVELSTPAGAFTAPLESKRPSVLVSAGIGITPFVSMLEHASALESSTRFFLFHGARNSLEDASRKLLSAAVIHNPNVQRFVAYSQPTAEDKRADNFQFLGRLTPGIIRQTMSSLNADYFLCGPPSLLSEMKAGLLAFGIDPKQIRQESFGIPSLVSTATTGGEGFDVILQKSNRILTWTGKEETLLELAEAHGLSPNYYCRAGICHTCKTRLLSGEITYVIPVPQTPDSGQVLICCAKPKGNVILDL